MIVLYSSNWLISFYCLFILFLVSYSFFYSNLSWFTSSSSLLGCSSISNCLFLFNTLLTFLKHDIDNLFSYNYNYSRLLFCVKWLIINLLTYSEMKLLLTNKYFNSWLFWIYYRKYRIPLSPILDPLMSKHYNLIISILLFNWSPKYIKLSSPKLLLPIFRYCRLVVDMTLANFWIPNAVNIFWLMSSLFIDLLLVRLVMRHSNPLSLMLLPLRFNTLNWLCSLIDSAIYWIPSWYNWLYSKFNDSIFYEFSMKFLN